MYSSKKKKDETNVRLNFGCCRIPNDPQPAATPQCTPMGPIGMAVSDVTFYNPYTAELASAPECETLDECGGHPDPRG